MDQAQKPGKLKTFFIGKGPESECPFHRMNHRLYEGVAGIFRKKEPMKEEKKDLHEK